MGETLDFTKRANRESKSNDQPVGGHGVEVRCHSIDKQHRQIRQRFPSTQASVQQMRQARI